ncbi:MAG: hypothetical protein NC820_06290, partial [Candidatus Omnitrophica bacterium]|nr:hypothetical protein [Candidatus Omnitrophota bacterium]
KLGGSSLYDLEIDKEGEVILDSDLVVGNNLLINRGILNAQGKDIDIGGDWINRGSYISGYNTVRVIDVSKVTTIYGDNDFYNFVCEVGGKVIRFEADKLQRIKGELRLIGEAMDLLNLGSSIEGIQWKIEPKGIRDVRYVRVKDSWNTTGLFIEPINSVDNGNNIYWFKDWVNAPGIGPIEFTPVITIGGEEEVEIEIGGRYVNEGFIGGIRDIGVGYLRYDDSGVKRYRKRYERGKYRTVVIVIEGRVVACPYEDGKIRSEETEVLEAGERLEYEGEVK